MKKQTTITNLVGLALAGGVMLGGVQAAEGVSYNTAFQQVATQAGTVGQEAGYTFNDVSIADYYDNGDGVISTGDVVLGGLELSTLQTNDGGGGSAPLTDAAGVYGIEVTDYTPDSASNPAGPGTASFSAITAAGQSMVLTKSGMDPYGVDGISATEMFAATQGGDSTDADSAPPQTGAFFDDAYSDGDLYATLNDLPRPQATGFGYKIDFSSADLSTLNSAGTNIALGNIRNSFLDIVNDGTGSGEGIGDQNHSSFTALGTSTPIGDVQPTGGVKNQQGSSAIGGDYVFSDFAQFDVKVTAVPEPVTALGGLMMFGVLATRRRKWARA